jgi:hypothetical protein
MKARHTLPFLLLLIALATLVSPAHAQPGRPRTTPPRSLSAQSPRHLFIKAFNYGDSIVLRWNVDRGAYWLSANKRGYVLERIEYSGTRARSVKKRLRLATIRPWSLDSMKKTLSHTDQYVAIAAQLLHGKTYAQPEKNTIADFYQTYERQQGQLLTAAMAAEFSAGAANALGLRWVDRTVDKSVTRYEYRIWINNGPNPKPGDLADTAAITVSPVILNFLSAPQVSGVDSGDSTLTVRWYRYHNMGSYSGYYIERSADGKKFKRLNDVPYVASRSDTAQADTSQLVNPNEVTYTDSIEANYRKYYYRIIGINSFGDLSPVSNVLVGSGRDRTPPRAPIDIQRTIEDNRRIILSWALPNPAPDLKGFYVGQANNISGPYQPLMKTLLPPSTRTFTNAKPVPYLGRHYVIAVVDTAGNVAYSPPITAVIDDKTPPASPKKLVAKVDTSGIVTLRWTGNPEPDVLGYKVYRSYQRENEYYQQRTLNILADSVFVDTLPTRTLTRQAFYKLVAVDLSNNHSEFSEPFAVTIPDKVSPATPVIKAAFVENRGIRLILIPSLSDDVTEHTVYRRQPGEAWQPVTQLTGNPTTELTYLDSALTHQQAYEYSLIARDGSGLTSDRSVVVTAQYVNIDRLSVSPPTDLQILYDPQQKAIRLSWKSSVALLGQRFMIYRSLRNEPPVLYRSVEQATTFTDQNLPVPGTYTYAVQLVTTDKKSPLSRSVQVTYNQ